MQSKTKRTATITGVVLVGVLGVGAIGTVSAVAGVNALNNVTASQSMGRGGGQGGGMQGGGQGSDMKTTPERATTPAGTLTPEMAQKLTYLVEEEKLAHDVYVLADSLYGSNTYGNISSSETRHMSAVSGLLTTYKLPNPTTGEAAGVFNNAELQKLYDELAARVRTSESEAAAVGILIEETDLADLNATTATNPPSDVSRVLSQLTRGSENHLRAFTNLSERV